MVNDFTTFYSNFFFQKPVITNNNYPEGYSSGGPETYGTLVKEDHTEVRRSRGFPAIGRALMRMKSGKRSTSAPNLGDGNTNIETAVEKCKYVSMPCFVYKLIFSYVSCDKLVVKGSISSSVLIFSQLLFYLFSMEKTTLAFDSIICYN